MDDKGCKVFNFQKDKFFVLVCFLAIVKAQLRKNIHFLFRNGPGEDFTEQNFQRALTDSNLRDKIYKKIYTASKNYQNSWANLSHARNVLAEICRSQGTPSIFVTLSSAEHK